MKRIGLVAVAVMALVACSVAWAGGETGNGSISSDAKPMMSKSAMKGDAALQEKLEGMERKVWEGFKNKDMKAAKEVLAEDCISVDMNGMATMDQFESMMQDYAVTSYELSDFKVKRLNKDAAILTYTVSANATFKGQAIPAGPYYASSAYVARGGKWVGVYHQETLSMTAMPSAGMESPSK